MVQLGDSITRLDARAKVTGDGVTQTNLVE
jgi:hypothetical protein